MLSVCVYLWKSDTLPYSVINLTTTHCIFVLSIVIILTINSNEHADSKQLVISVFRVQRVK